MHIYLYLKLLPPEQILNCLCASAFAYSAVVSWYLFILLYLILYVSGNLMIDAKSNRDLLRSVQFDMEIS